MTLDAYHVDEAGIVSLVGGFCLGRNHISSTLLLEASPTGIPKLLYLINITIAISIITFSNSNRCLIRTLVNVCGVRVLSLRCGLAEGPWIVILTRCAFLSARKKWE
jgi:hypothetical protein